MIREDEVFKIGKFAKPHGVKGEIALLSDRDLFDKVEDPYVVCEMDGILVPFFIESYRYKGEAVILLKLEQVDSEESAREFINKEVFFAWDELDEEDREEAMVWSDLIDFEVTDRQHGWLGHITAVDDSTMNVLLQIDHEGEELLLPAVEEFVSEIDYEQKRMIVSLPDGLLDL